MAKYQDENNVWHELVLKPGGDTLPIGTIVPFGGSTVPTNWLLCDGSLVSRTDYNYLFSAIGTTYGAGDGSTTFALPNLKGKTLVGIDSSDTDFNTLGKTGGEKTHTLTVNEIPAHKHELAYGPTTIGENPGWTYGLAQSAGTTEAGGKGWRGNLGTFEEGGDQPHNNLQPYEVTNYIIKAKNSVGLVGNVVTNIEATGANDVPNAQTIKAALGAIKESIDACKTLNLDATWLTATYAHGQGLYVHIPILNPKNEVLNINITSAEIFDSNGEWKDITYVLAGYTTTQVSLNFDIGTAELTKGSIYLVRITGTIIAS